MTSAIVTGYVEIEGHPRSRDEYHRLGQKLLGTTTAVHVARTDLKNCWLYDFLESRPAVSHSVADNPKKNTLAYHIVQAQKTEFLRHAASRDPFSDVFVWIDYGICHLPGVTAKIIDAFMARVENEQAIAIPGCWSKDYVYDDHKPCWRWCGGVMVVPRRFVTGFDLAMKAEYVDWIDKTNNVSWEVNTLARLERRDRQFPGWWYQADHNETIFTHYKATEHADGKAQV